jgi:hypothetical protein
MEVLLALGDARSRAGAFAAARDAYQQAAALARRRGRPEELARAALGFAAGLGFEVRLYDHRQVALLEEALAALPPGDSALRAWVLARLSVALSYVAPAERRHQLAAEAVAIARRLGDRAALAYALSGTCDAIAGPEHAERRLAPAEELTVWPPLGATWSWSCSAGASGWWRCWSSASSRPPSARWPPTRAGPSACGSPCRPGTCRCGGGCSRCCAGGWRRPSGSPARPRRSGRAPPAPTPPSSASCGAGC